MVRRNFLLRAWPGGLGTLCGVLPICVPSAIPSPGSLPTRPLLPLAWSGVSVEPGHLSHLPLSRELWAGAGEDVVSSQSARVTFRSLVAVGAY